MSTQILTGDDIRFYAQQPDYEVSTMVGQMTTLMQNITSLQSDTDDKVKQLESQGWFKRMTNTLFGKNRATKQEIQKNNDRVVTYISQSVSQLYQMNLINERVICSLGNRMNEVYMQVTEMYQEQLNMKAQMSEIMAVQQQTLEAMGAFVSKLNEKIESVDNFHMLVSEMQNGMYCDSSRLYNICSILSQLDKRQMDDSRKMNLLVDTMQKTGIITYDELTILQCLQEIVALPQEKIGLIYLELCNFRNSFPANLFADMIEGYHFLSKMEKMSKKKETIIQRVLDYYELDADATFSIADIAESFIENKQASLIDISNIKQIETNDNTAVQQAAINDNSNQKENIDSNTSQKENIDSNTSSNNEIKFGSIVRRLCDTGKVPPKWKVIDVLPNGSMSIQNVNYGTVVKVKKSEVVLYDEKNNNFGVQNTSQNNIHSQQQNETEELTDEDLENIAYALYYGPDNETFGIDGIEQDYNEAAEIFEDLAQKGMMYSQYMFGEMCYYGEGGLQKNFQRAAKWYRKAAEQGVRSAQNLLGMLYYNGNGVKQSYQEAFNWFKKAAAQDSAVANFNIGIMYEDGSYVKQDYGKAEEYFIKAADLGYEDALEHLTVCPKCGGYRINTEVNEHVGRSILKGGAAGAIGAGVGSLLGPLGMLAGTAIAGKFAMDSASKDTTTLKHRCKNCNYYWEEEV